MTLPLTFGNKTMQSVKRDRYRPGKLVLDASFAEDKVSSRGGSRSMKHSSRSRRSNVSPCCELSRVRGNDENERNSRERDASSRDVSGTDIGAGSNRDPALTIGIEGPGGFGSSRGGEARVAEGGSVRLKLNFDFGCDFVFLSLTFASKVRRSCRLSHARRQRLACQSRQPPRVAWTGVKQKTKRMACPLAPRQVITRNVVGSLGQRLTQSLRLSSRGRNVNLVVIVECRIELYPSRVNPGERSKPSQPKKKFAFPPGEDDLTWPTSE